jgi:hypothetical protein
MERKEVGEGRRIKKYVRFGKSNGWLISRVSVAIQSTKKHMDEKKNGK